MTSNLAENIEEAPYVELHKNSSGTKKNKHDKISALTRERDLLNTCIYDPERMDFKFYGIAENINSELLAQGLTAGELSELACIDYSNFSKFLRQEQHITSRILFRVAAALVVPVESLFPPEENKRVTNGDRFNELTKECDLQTVNMLLGLVADIVKDGRRIRHFI